MIKLTKSKNYKIPIVQNINKILIILIIKISAFSICKYNSVVIFLCYRKIKLKNKDKLRYICNIKE